MKHNECMGIFCPEEKRNNCQYHKEWQKTNQQVGVFFGKSDCEHFKQVWRFDSKDHYPPLYKRVFIEYFPADSALGAIAKDWISVNDDDEYIWTLADSDEIIEDKQWQKLFAKF